MDGLRERVRAWRIAASTSMRAAAVGAFATTSLLLDAAQGLQGQQPGYRMDQRPSLVVSDHSGGVPFVSLVGSVTLSNQSIWAVDEGESRATLYSPAGRPIKSIGRQGGGPGEFRTISWLGLCTPDTLSIFDAAQGRVSRIDAEGKLVDVSPVSMSGIGVVLPTGAPVYELFCSRGGRVAAVSWPVGPPPSEPGPHRGTVRVATASGFKEPLRELGTFPGPERYRFARSDGPRPFGKRLHVALSSTRLFVGSADSFFVEAFDLAGARQRPAAATVPAKKFDRANEDYLLSTMFRKATAPADRQRAKVALAEHKFPEWYPAYTKLLVDTSDRLWVQLPSSLGDTVQQWYAFDERGRTIARLAVPVALQLHEIGNAHVMGRWTEADGTESLRRFAVYAR